MRVVAVAIMVLASVLMSGCGGGNRQEAPTPISMDFQLTPTGNNDFILIGQTGIFVRTAPAAVDTPTLLRLTRFSSSAGLVAPIPSGFGFVGGASIKRVNVPDETVLAAPVILRIPPSTPLPKGQRIMVMVAETLGRVPVFKPLLDSSGKPTTCLVGSDGRVEFRTHRLGSFAIVNSSGQ
jgi:hypothetical protein